MPAPAPEEVVALFTPQGDPAGSAARSLVRAGNLWHAATAVLLRHPDGRVYVHRRTESKDVFPGAYDCWAGGVLLAGEQPDQAAARELAEELGVRGVPLRALFTTTYADERTRYHAHVYEAVYGGPVTHQAAEVSWGAWLTWAQLDDLLADPARPFVPDGRALLQRYRGRGG